MCITWRFLWITQLNSNLILLSLDAVYNKSMSNHIRLAVILSLAGLLITSCSNKQGGGATGGGISSLNPTASSRASTGFTRSKSTVVHLYGSEHVTQTALSGSSQLNDVASIANILLSENGSPDIEFRTGGSISPSVVTSDIALGYIESQDYMLFEKAGVHDCDHAAYNNAMQLWYDAASLNSSRQANRYFYVLPQQQTGPTGCIAFNDIINGSAFSQTISNFNAGALSGETNDVSGYLNALNANFVSRGFPFNKANGYSATVWNKIAIAIIILKDLNEEPVNFSNLVSQIMANKDAIISESQATTLTQQQAIDNVQAILNVL